MCAKNNKISFNSVLNIIKESLSLDESDQLHSMVDIFKYDVLYGEITLQLFEKTIHKVKVIRFTTLSSIINY